MSTTEERLKILNMVAEGKITAEDGARLLNALKDADRKSSPAGQGFSAGEEGRYLRVLVSDLEGRQKVNVNIPMNLVNVGLRMGAKFAPELDGFDYEDIMTAIRNGSRGRIIDVTDQDNGEHVEIFVE
jgi:SHOCT-like domain